MQADIMQDITGYIDFLRESGYDISVSGFDRVLGMNFPLLYEYEIHRPSVCAFLKSDSATAGRCIENKERLKRSCPEKPYYGCCYAGVEEFVIPVMYEDRAIVLINLSGYRGKLKISEFLKKRIARRCNREQFESLYADLSPEVPPLEKALRLSKPLFYMFTALYEECRLEIKNDTPADRIYSGAIAYIYDNYMHSVSCRDIADSVSYSESYVRHIFSKRCGMSMAAFISEVRLNKARELLLSTSLSVSDVAYSAGFCDANNFSTAFKRKFGAAPGKYRKLNLNCRIIPR